MLVRVNFGWKAGRIEDIEPTAARQMLADGRATAVNYDPGPAKSDADAPGEPAASKGAKPAKRNR